MSEYRKKAEECLRAAKRMRDPTERMEMLGIARGYMTLADHADRSRIDSLQQKGQNEVKWGEADRGETNALPFVSLTTQQTRGKLPAKPCVNRKPYPS